MRVILYTGKGGVGKTSLAAASAVQMAREGKRVLIMSTDQAHSLGDSFGIELGNEPMEIEENLSAMEIDAAKESEKSWGRMKEYFKRLLTVQTEQTIEMEELLVFPGLEELFSMFKILEMHEKEIYDVMIIDCAPTGETLSLLKYPERLEQFMSKVLPMKRKGVKVAGPAVEKLAKIPMPKDDLFDELEQLLDKMGRLQNLLLDKRIVSVRIVTTPEQIVITEAKRSFTCLLLFNYNVDAILVNKIYPRKALDGYFNQWITMQEQGLKEIKESFSEVPKVFVELQPTELRNTEVLGQVGKAMWDQVPDAKSYDVLFSQEVYQLKHGKEGISLRIYLPFANKSDLDLRQAGQELRIGVKNEVRTFPLPKELLDHEISGAKFENGYLNITFDEK